MELLPYPLLVGLATWLVLANGIWAKVTKNLLRVLFSTDIPHNHSSLQPLLWKEQFPFALVVLEEWETCSRPELNLEPNPTHGPELNWNFLPGAKPSKPSKHHQSHPDALQMYAWETNTNGCMPLRFCGCSATQRFYGNSGLMQKLFEVSNKALSAGCVSPEKMVKKKFWKDTKQTKLLAVLFFRNRFGESGLACGGIKRDHLFFILSSLTF